jgi:hypothetical protein
MDKDGLLWIKHKPSNWDDVRNLQSFDLKYNCWIDYTNYEGFPQYGVVDFIKDSSGRLHVVDRDKRLYVLNDISLRVKIFSATTRQIQTHDFTVGTMGLLKP